MLYPITISSQYPACFVPFPSWTSYSEWRKAGARALAIIPNAERLIGYPRHRTGAVPIFMGSWRVISTPRSVILSCTLWHHRSWVFQWVFHIPTFIIHILRWFCPDSSWKFRSRPVERPTWRYVFKLWISISFLFHFLLSRFLSLSPYDIKRLSHVLARRFHMRGGCF